jgi:hypothetical protein
MAVLQELVTQQVSESVILLVEGEDGSVWSACDKVFSTDCTSWMQICLRVSIFSSIFFSPSARRKASVLQRTMIGQQNRHTVELQKQRTEYLKTRAGAD